MKSTKMLRTDHEPPHLGICNDATETTLSPKHSDRRKRDSGYGTDYSPAAVPAATRRFTFDSECDGSELDLSGEFGNMEIYNDVFADENVDVLNKQIYDSDDADREVETLLCESGELGQNSDTSLYVKINPIRPAAPIPIPDVNWADLQTQSDYNTSIDHSSIASESHLVPGNICKRCKTCRFRPISRNLGTQSPGPFCQMMNETTGVLIRPRFQPYSFTSGSGLSRLRHRSENERGACVGDLPDVVPIPRDRSISLPDIPGLRQCYELQVGRELRRISDDFNKDKKKLSSGKRTSPFIFKLDVRDYVTTIGRYLSPTSGISKEEIEKNEAHGSSCIENTLRKQ